MNHMQKLDEKKKRFIIIIVIVLAVILAAGIVVVYYRAGMSGKENNANGIIMEENASEWDGQMNDLSGNQAGIKIPGYGELTVPAGETTWKITLVNPKDNNCYFQYAITIDEDNTPIYESGYIEPGKAVTEFDVEKPLEAGEYTIYMNISTCSMDGDYTRLNGASVKADLHVVD